ncbi:MAG TPA: ribose 5-phosphate isomerase B [Pantanalinema sp.]
MRIALGSDHAGFDLKEALEAWLLSQGHVVSDLGCHDTTRTDYPPIAHALAREITSGRAERGVLVCGSGIGVSIAANRIEGARAALVNEPVSARLAREHNDANIVCLGARLVGPDMAQEILRVFLETPFEGGRHEARVAMIDAVTL